MVLGAIQIPPNGQPILMMSDHATTGGYPKIATVVRDPGPIFPLWRNDYFVGAQQPRCPYDFKQTTIEAAQERYRAMMMNLKTGIVEPEENFYFA